MVSAYHLLVYRLISSHISIGCIVADIANSEFHMHNIFDLLSCVGNFPSSLLQYEHVRDNDLLIVVTGHMTIRGMVVQLLHVVTTERHASSITTQHQEYGRQFFGTHLLHGITH